MNRVYALSKKKAKHLVNLWMEYENCMTPQEATKLRKQMLKSYQQLQHMTNTKR